MPTAKVTLNVTNFIGIDALVPPPRCTTVANPIITDSANGKLTLDATDPTLLVVNGRASLNIEFTIGAAASLQPPNSFSPAGIAFKQKVGGTDPKGKGNFDFVSLTPTTITINAKNVDHGTGAAAPRWSFYILIQDQANLLGIIDPDIENEN